MSLFSFFLITALVAFALTPLVIWSSKKFRVLDFPWRPHPAILHTGPIPRAGGAATFLAIVVGYLVFVHQSGSVALDKHIVGILLAGLLGVVVGILDDKYDLNPYLRLATNILAAGIIVASGVGITWFTNPFGGQVRLDEIILHFNFPDILPFHFFAGLHSIILWADLFAFIWIIWVMNALNWSSGVDGQLPGMAAIGLLALGFASYRLLQGDQTQL